MAWSSNTKNGWMVVHEGKEVEGPFDSREECMKAAENINGAEAQPMTKHKTISHTKKRVSQKPKTKKKK